MVYIEDHIDSCNNAQSRAHKTTQITLRHAYYLLAGFGVADKTEYGYRAEQRQLAWMRREYAIPWWICHKDGAICSVAEAGR